jgi:hypothetical protein
MNWICATTEGKRRSRARITETRIVSTLMHMQSGGVHVLHGEHGQRILTEAERLWNTVNFNPGGVVTSCAGDYLTPASRSKYLTR